MSALRVYDFPGETRDVRFDCIAPAGFRLLSALETLARRWPRDVFLTCGTEGTHRGQEHARGVAYDVRSNDCASHEEKLTLSRAIVEQTDDGPVYPVDGHDGEAGYYSAHFFAFLESPGSPNEHIHCQLRQGVNFP